MEPHDLYNGLSYAYPIAIFVTSALSPVLQRRSSFRLQLESPAAIKVKTRCFQAIYYIQLLLVASLFGAIVAGGISFVKSIHVSHTASTVEQANVAANIALFFLFGSGTLPTPGEPFRPRSSDLHVWLASIAFEAGLLTVALTSPASCPLRNEVQLELRVARICVLACMTAIFLYSQHARNGSSSSTPDESESLLGDEAGHVAYDTISPAQTTTQGDRIVLDHGNVGWIDYFIGFRTLFPYIWPSDSLKDQLLTVFCFSLMIAQRVVNIFVPYYLGQLVESVGTGHMPYKQIALYITFLAMQGQQGALGSLRAVLWIPIGQSLYRRLTCAAFEHVMCLSLEFHLSKRLGEVTSALSKGSAINTFLEGLIFQLFPMIFDLFVAAVFLFVRSDPFYAIIVLAVMWTYVFVTIYMAKHRALARREMTNRNREMEAVKTDAMMSYETVHQNSAVIAECNRFEQQVESFQTAEYSVLFSLATLNIIQSLLFTTGTALMILLSTYKISVGMQTVGFFVSVLAYFAQLQAPLAFFGSFYTMVQNNLIDSERMLELFQTIPEVQDSADAQHFLHCVGDVEFENVNFSYGAGKVALRDVSFSVPRGKTTAIVGESGSGKSTCLKLLFRFYDLQQGSIRVDGRKISTLKMNDLRSHFGVVPQDTILFNASVLENVLYARPSATEEEVFSACRAANIHDQILSLPQGYSTSVGERGLRLSGGEKQRIAIARAILKGAQIMLLDEATSALDSHTESLIQEALEKLTKDRTTIVIAHRLSTVTKADQILVMHEGRVVQRGTHAELLGTSGRYRELWARQTKAENEKNKSTGAD